MNMQKTARKSGKFRFTLRHKVIASFVFVYAVLTFNFLYLIVVNQHRIAEEKLTDSSWRKADLISMAISEYVREKDTRFLERFVENTLDDKEIEYVRVLDLNGSVLVEAGLLENYAELGESGFAGEDLGKTGGIHEIGHPEGLMHESGHRFYIASPVTFQGSKVGEFHLGINTVELNRRLATITYRGAVYAGVTILIGVVLTLFLYRQMQGAMRKLIQSTVHIARGDLTERVTTGTGDELEELAVSFNRMADAIADREREIVNVKNTMVSMFNGITAAIAYISKDYDILYANPAYAALLSANLKGDERTYKCFELFGHGERGCEGCPGKTAMESGKSEEAERETTLEGGKRQVLWIHAYPVMIPGEGQAGFVEYILDITRQREMEEELKNYTEHLEEIVQERTRRLREAQEQMIHREKIAALGEIAAGVAHEIGNPLSSLSSIIRGFELTLEGDEERKEKVRLMQEQVGRIARIVREMTDFSRPAQFRKSLTHVNEVVKTALGIARYDKRFKGVDVKTSFDAEIPATKVDGDKLLQVFLNIIFNAADVMKGEGSLRVTTKLVNGLIAVSFGDEGPGISEEQLKKVFEPFYTTKEIGEGTGLGLSVSYGIMQSMGGSIRAENQSEGGLLFTVDIPLQEPGGITG